MVNPGQKITQVEQAEKGKEKGADLHSDFSMEVEIPESAEIPSATNKTAAGILTLPDISAAPTQSTSAQSRPTTPPNTKHPSPASAGNSPARKQRNTQSGSRLTRSASQKTLSSLPDTIPKKFAGGKWFDVCPLCYNKYHSKMECTLLTPFH